MGRHLLQLGNLSLYVHAVLLQNRVSDLLLDLKDVLQLIEFVLQLNTKLVRFVLKVGRHLSYLSLIDAVLR